jgi:hypothetical protein
VLRYKIIRLFPGKETITDVLLENTLMNRPLYPEFLGLRTAGATITSIFGRTGAVTLLAVDVRACDVATPEIAQHYEYVNDPLRRCAWCQAPNQAIEGMCEGWTEHSPTRGKHCCRLHTKLASQQRQRMMPLTFAGYQGAPYSVR